MSSGAEMDPMPAAGTATRFTVQATEWGTSGKLVTTDELPGRPQALRWVGYTWDALGGAGYSSVPGMPSPGKFAACLGLSQKEFQALTDPSHGQSCAPTNQQRDEAPGRAGAEGEHATLSSCMMRHWMRQSCGRKQDRVNARGRSCTRPIGFTAAPPR
jgi:hypothetical protein